MRVLLDECVHGKVAQFLTGHVVLTVTQAGWRGMRNGELLRKAATGFDVFVTSDKNIEYQQHEASLPLPVLIISTGGNTWEDLLGAIPKLQAILAQTLSRQFYIVR